VVIIWHFHFTNKNVSSKTAVPAMEDTSHYTLAIRTKTTSNINIVNNVYRNVTNVQIITNQNAPSVTNISPTSTTIRKHVLNHVLKNIMQN